MNKNIKHKMILGIVLVLIASITASITYATATYYFNLPTNGIGYFEKPKEVTKVIVQNVKEHIICPNGMIEVTFELKNTDGKLKDVEVWIYFKTSSGTILAEKYVYVGDMNSNEVKTITIEQLVPNIDSFVYEGFSIHYTR